MERIFTNCSVVTRDAVFSGSVAVANGSIKDIDTCRYSGTGTLDLGGNFIGIKNGRRKRLMQSSRNSVKCRDSMRKKTEPSQ